MVDVLISGSALRQGYGSKMVLHDVDLQLSAGLTGLLGPNGAGKTTLLRTLATVVPPRGGSLELAGLDATRPAALSRIRRQLGYLPQGFGFPPRFTVSEFVSYSAWLRGMERTAIRPAASEVIASVGLSDSARTQMRRLSHGMRQRAGIAATIIGRPRIIVALTVIGLIWGLQLVPVPRIAGLGGTVTLLWYHPMLAACAIATALTSPMPDQEKIGSVRIDLWNRLLIAALATFDGVLLASVAAVIGSPHSGTQLAAGLLYWLALALVSARVLNPGLSWVLPLIAYIPVTWWGFGDPAADQDPRWWAVPAQDGGWPTVLSGMVWFVAGAGVSLVSRHRLRSFGVLPAGSLIQPAPESRTTTGGSPRQDSHPPAG